MVASYSPHRQHGETATLFSRPHSKSPSSRHLLHSPTSCSSSFSITIPVSATTKTRSATRRQSTTSLKSRGSSAAPDSPTKFPLTLTTHNNMNSSGMTLRSGSSSPRPASPRDKLATQRQNRAGIGVENKELHKPSAGSPLKRSDGIMNLNEVSRGSPVAKRRSAVGAGLFSSVNSPPIFGSSSFGTSSPSPKRNSGVKKGSGSVFGDKPNFAKSRPQARQQTDFVPPSDPASRMRRVNSVENFFGASKDSPFGNHVAPLPNASIHPFNGNTQSSQHPHPLSQTFNHSTPGASAEPSSQESNGLVTPQNYKFAKPFPAAFHSTGFVPKRGRLLNAEKDHGPQPDTPCKRPTAPLFSQSALQSKGIAGKTRGLSMSMTDFASSSSPAESETRRWKLLARKTSTMSNDDGEDNQSSGEYELPPTPTKKAYGNFGSFFTANKRLRTDTSSDGLRGRYVIATPHTPRESIVPPDPSSLSISGRANNASKIISPATPSPSKEYFARFNFDSSSPPTHAVQSADGQTVHVSDDFVQRFSEVKYIGSGEFSEVYQVTQGLRRHAFMESLDPPLTPQQLATPKNSSIYGSSPLRSSRAPSLRTYAVKKSKSTLVGNQARARRLEEVDILRELGTHDHVVEFVHHWEEAGHLYIQTEFCENGSLDKFLEMHGNKGRLDEFRVWKVLLELCLGLKHIHNSGFIHLDLKPANVLITFDGALKISDFGMAARWPVVEELEREGDREYIAPEVISSARYDKPVDIFALGLTIIEVAGNETLPPNGPDWQKLRDGDISVAPILSTSSSGEFVHRDEKGNPVATEMVNGFLEDEPFSEGPSSPTLSRRPKQASDQQLALSGKRRSGSLLHVPRSGDLVHPPRFMEERGLEEIVTWMISADPGERPTISELLERHELIWVDVRRRAAATVFEGLWGPDDSLLSLSEDEDMVCSQSASSEIGNYQEEDWRMEEM